MSDARGCIQVDFDSFRQVVFDRRSVRRFQDRPVPVEAIRELVDCARHAPSDTNSQSWEFIAVLNRLKINEIAAATWTRLHQVADEASRRGLNKEARLLLRSFGPYATAFEHAPALVVALSLPYTSKFRERIFDPMQLVSDDVWDIEGLKSSSLAAQNLMLCAHAMNLGSCPMTGPVLLAEQELKALLAIEADRQVNMVIALGYPDEKPTKPRRKEVDEILRVLS